MLRDKLPDLLKSGEFGGTNFILADDKDGLDAKSIARAALERGVIVEPMFPCFSKASQGVNFFRLGVSSIRHDRVEEGIDRLCQAIDDIKLLGGRS
ncbi:hypothetical protein [Aliiroseovarius sp. 2305UL8-7]|uniref:hypothetical protein n=1 Tax=Aliiroseovarius conchicola TaxID=3121637 RepID=UPI003527E942